MPDKVTLYTVTSDHLAIQRYQPIKLGSNDGGATWTTWPRQTRPFGLKTPAEFTTYRLEFGGTGAVGVAEFELMGPPSAPAAATAASL